MIKLYQFKIFCFIKTLLRKLKRAVAVAKRKYLQNTYLRKDWLLFQNIQRSLKIQKEKK